MEKQVHQQSQENKAQVQEVAATPTATTSTRFLSFNDKVLPYLPERPLSVLLTAIGLVTLVALFLLWQNRSFTVVAELDAPQGEWIEDADIAITSPAKLGTTTIRVRKKTTTINHAKTIKRLVGIQPEVDKNLDANFVFRYKERELNGLDEAQLILYSSSDDGATWVAHRNSKVNTAANTISLDGVGHFSLWTAGPLSAAFVVNTADDTDDGTCDTGHCSLREAMTAANAAGAGPHFITFDPSIDMQTIILTADLPIVSVADVTINGDIDNDGTWNIIIDADGGDNTRYIFRGNAGATNATFIGFRLETQAANPSTSTVAR